jgi:hypothetical protein
MRNNLSQAIQTFFNAETLPPFFIGSIFLAILGNSIYDILKNWLGTDTSSLMTIAFSAFLFFVFAVFLAVQAINRRSSHLNRRLVIPGTRSPKKFRGLILLVSRPEPCRTAIQYHLPSLQQCWLICSVQSLEAAQQIAKEYPHICSGNPMIINNIYDPIEFRNTITEIYQDYLPKGWIDQDIIADYTGMTAHASVGMVLSCIGLNRPLQYTPVATDPATKTPVSLAPIEITLT